MIPLITAFGDSVPYKVREARKALPAQGRVLSEARREGRHPSAPAGHRLGGAKVVRRLRARNRR